MKLFGLRISRLRPWLRAVREAGALTSKKLYLAAHGVVFRRRDLPPAKLARWRYRHCLRCPMHTVDARGGRGCRLCGCYTPYLVSGTRPETACPAKIVNPWERFGWDR